MSRSESEKPIDTKEQAKIAVHTHRAIHLFDQTLPTTHPFNIATWSPDVEHLADPDRPDVLWIPRGTARSSASFKKDGRVLRVTKSKKIQDGLILDHMVRLDRIVIVEDTDDSITRVWLTTMFERNRIGNQTVYLSGIPLALDRTDTPVPYVDLSGRLPTILKDL